MLTRTTTQLLESLRDSANTSLWRHFDERYRPVLLSLARKQGLSEEDAADVAQTTLTQFTADYQAGRYDRSRGRLSSWIIGIASHRIADVRRSAQRQRIQRGESVFAQIAEHAPDTKDWEEAKQRVILERAISILRTGTRMDERTILAFDLCAIRNVPPEAAAEQCGMTVAEVYVAKNRAIRKLREIIAQLTQEFDEG